MAEHVVRALWYRVEWAPGVDYEKAPPVHAETDDFTMSLDGKKLQVKPKQGRIPSSAEARTVVEEYLYAWTVLINLQHGRTVRFAFDKAEVEAVPESISQEDIRKKGLEGTVTVTATVDRHVSLGPYPTPPAAFVASPTVKAMFVRYEEHQSGREPLLSMASFCLTVLEQSAGGSCRRERAARKYSIDKKVLDTLGEICANRGSVEEARKAPQNLRFGKLDPTEAPWVVEVVKSMIRRAGEVAADPDKDYPLLTMANLSSKFRGRNP